MINYVFTELFESPAKVLVNTVNTVGVMGKGIAKQFKYYYPEMFCDYQLLCERNQFQIGQLWLYKTPNKWVLNFPTKKHWRQPSRPEYIELGLKKFVDSYTENSMFSIAFPMLGCGNGELSWTDTVRPMMEKYLKSLPIEIFIHVKGPDPFVPEHRDPIAMKQWLRSEPQTLGFAEVWEDLYELVTKQSRFETFKDESFTAQIVTKDDIGIEVRTDNTTAVLYKDALLDLWQGIRTLGFCMDRTMPNGLDRYSKLVVALFSKLPYLDPILLTTPNKQTIGLRLHLHKQNDGMPLFSSSGVSIQA